MDTLMGFAVLGIATLVALFSALGLNWLLLRTAFVLMQPATANRRVTSPAIEHGTRLAARAYGQLR